MTIARSALLTAVALILLLPSLNAQVTGYTPSGDRTQLLRIALPDGETEIVGSFNSGAMSALAFAPDGRLYGIDYQGDRLMAIDTNTGAASPLLSLSADIPRSTGMAFDACGNLWAKFGESNTDVPIHRVNLSNGDVEEFANDGSLNPYLTAKGEVLYTITLLEVLQTDAVSGVTSLVVRSSTEIVVCEFDAIGRLWVLAGEFGIQPLVAGFAVLDLESGELHSFGALTIRFPASLAISPPGGVCASQASGPPALQVPLLSGWGMSVLLLALIGLALRRLL